MGSRLSPTTAHDLLDLHNKRRSPFQCTATGESLWKSDQGNLHLRHDRDVDDLHNWNVLRRRSDLNLRHLHCSRTPRRCLVTGTSTTAGTAPATPPCTCRRNNGHVTTLSKNCNCTVWTKAPVLHNNGQDSLVQELDNHVDDCTTGTSTTTSKNQTQPACPAATTPPQPRHHHTTPPSEPISSPTQLKSSQTVPPPQSQNLTQGGEHLGLAEVEPVGGLVDTATVVYDSASPDDVTILTSIAVYNALAIS